MRIAGMSTVWVIAEFTVELDADEQQPAPEEMR